MDELQGNGREKDPKSIRAVRRAFLRRPPPFLDTVLKWFEYPRIRKILEPNVKKGQVVADIGCGWGYYTFALADLVGPEGKIHSVDLSKNCIRSIQKKAMKAGLNNIIATASTAADLRFIQDNSVDFVFSNGLLCSMENDRESAVNEIKRILKPGGLAYISLGGTPPFGLVDETEWNQILEGFKVENGGSYKELWALVSSRHE
jgi:ubiquinone/menaquinone biosynthesis C-methylase UbiE